MKNNESLQQFANNKKLLFILPHLIYISSFFTKFYNNEEYLIFKNIFPLLLIFFIITTILYLILKIFIKKEQYIFYILFFICILYTNTYDLKLILELLLYSTLIFISLSIFKRFYKETINTCIAILMLCIICYFFISVPKTAYSFIKLRNNQIKYKEITKINVEEDLSTPNIYWIHCDGMMNLNDIQKYFHYNNKTLLNYLEEEGFYINKDASLVAGHKTQKALAALFNPNYYDNLLGKYLYELEDTYLDENKETSFDVSTNELVNKRFENELMLSLKEKGYTTIGISKFNNHSSLKTDIYYDFYNYSKNHWHFPEKKELRRISNSSNKNIELMYSIVQLKEILTYSILSPITNEIIPYSYETINYNELDTSNYPNINKTEFWQIKAILKSIEDTKNINNNKFFFINYDLSHIEMAFDKDGNKLEKKDYNNINKYIGNYIYTTKLLIEMVEYIKNNDSESIIILQGDHGIHTIEDKSFKKSLNLTKEEAQEIKNSTMNAVYIPEKYQTGEEKYLGNPLNISRYLVNNFVGKNYQYLEK